MEKKESKRKKGKLVATVFAVLLIIGGCVGYVMIYNSTHFLSTDNAKVSSKTITITPKATGKLMSWDVKVGDFVNKGQVLGHEENAPFITTPIRGQIVQSNVIQDQVVSPGMTLAIVADTADIYILTNIEETSIEKVQPGQTVDITIDAYPSVKFTGFVREIDRTTQQAFSGSFSLNTSGTYTKVVQTVPVKVTFDSQGYDMRLGLNAQVRIHIK